MKVSDSLSSLYLLSANVRLGAETSGKGAHAEAGNDSQAFVPTVTPGRPPSLGLENDLWLSGSHRQDAGGTSADLFAEFIEWSEMTEAERIRVETLERYGLSEDALAALPDDERAAVEEEVRRAVGDVLGIADTASAAGIVDL